MAPDDSPDVVPVLDEARNIARFSSSVLTVVVTAQVPVGTREQIAKLMPAENPAVDFQIACMPRLGATVPSFRRADRFVIGADDPTLSTCPG